MDIFEEVMVLF
jgi:hypothetical protein